MATACISQKFRALHNCQISHAVSIGSAHVRDLADRLYVGMRSSKLTV